MRRREIDRYQFQRDRKLRRQTDNYNNKTQLTDRKMEKCALNYM